MMESNPQLHHDVKALSVPGLAYEVPELIA